MSTTSASSEPLSAELGQVPICPVPLYAIKPSPENAKLYRPVREDDPEIIALAESVKQRGILEPLIVTADYWIVSGHRRHAAAFLAGLCSVPCRVMDFCREDDPDRFLVLLREHNRQREKSFDEKVREEIVNVNPADAYTALIEHRSERALVKVKPLVMDSRKVRAAITRAKRPFLDAVVAVLESLRKFWPVSDRQVHYPLLNDPPLRHASKPESAYHNDRPSYHSLCDLLTRARLEGIIPMDSIGDETRPVETWNVWRDVRGFVREELDGLLRHYWRDLMQSQPNHLEILVEKNTVANIVKPVAGQYLHPNDFRAGLLFAAAASRNGQTLPGIGQGNADRAHRV